MDDTKIMQMLNDEPDANGNYVHVIWCNGHRKAPIGTPDTLCNCKNLPLFQRLRAIYASPETKMETESP